MSINFYENQITGFLGQNGAGKTTTTLMMCGIYSSDSGTIHILDYEMRSNLKLIRSSIGFCPQQNILYDNLTVCQHLELVASIKGFSGAELMDEVVRISKLVALYENDFHKKSKQLSGGMKRRLAVAMALIGDSKIIILDEPTSGLDPFNRRSLWEIIKSYKQGRTIILTTHYMDEADALSDRIAIMHHGKVKSCGTPLFLKDKFGSGHNLTLTKQKRIDYIALEDLWREIFQDDMDIQSDTTREITILIPNKDQSKIPILLSKIEKQKQDLGIINFGISTSTLEDVFLKLD